MAARKGTLTKHQQEQVRSAIRSTQLVKRLQAFALGEKTEQGHKVDLGANEIRAIETLLRKTVPDLSSVTITDTEGNDAVPRLQVEIVAPAEDAAG